MGRATIVVVAINDPEVIFLRSTLLEEGAP